MSSKTKIVVIHMKEIIYTAIFVALALLLIVILAVMFFPKKNQNHATDPQYTPGVYTSTVSLNNTNFEVEVVVDSNHINAIQFRNLDESMTAMYPLMEPTLDYITEQVYENQSIENIIHSEENPYTSKVLVNAISDALDKASNVS